MKMPAKLVALIVCQQRFQIALSFGSELLNCAAPSSNG
jgi:hypothetical protein